MLCNHIGNQRRGDLAQPDTRGDLALHIARDRAIAASAQPSSDERRGMWAEAAAMADLAGDHARGGRG